MSARRLRQEALLCAAAVGVVAERLLTTAEGPPSLNLFLIALAGVCAMAWLVRRRGWASSRESVLLVLVALGFTAELVWHDADSLRAMNILTALLLVTLAAGRSSAAWLHRASVSDAVSAGLRVGLTIAAGPFGWTSSGEERAAEPSAAAPAWRRPAFAAARGAVLGIPLVIVFGGLLTSADPVFARMLDRSLSIDIERLLEHAVAAAILTWLAAGYLRAFVARKALVDVELQMRGERLGVIDVASALWLLNLLFIAFIGVQLRYLFGGADIVGITPGLGYAEYARRGFFELVTVAALVVPVLLAADWAARQETDRDRRMLRTTSLVQVVLLFAIMVSAVQRMRLYQDAYGLTEQRLFVSVFMGWIAFVLAWLAATVFRGQRQRFLAGAVVAGIVCVAGLNLANPHALIVRVNSERLRDGLEYDAVYAASLGADAVPQLAAHLPRLPLAQQCQVLDTWASLQSLQRTDWQTWNYSAWRAQRLIRRLPRPGECPPAAVTT